MTEPNGKRKRRKLEAADIVAVILASGLTVSIVLILIATIVQISHNERPEVPLSDNATSILLAAISGLSGLLGGYLGYGKRRKDDDRDEDNGKA